MRGTKDEARAWMVWNDFEDLDGLLGCERGLSRQQLRCMGQRDLHGADRLGTPRAHVKSLPLWRICALVQFKTPDRAWPEYSANCVLRLNDADILPLGRECGGAPPLLTGPCVNLGRDLGQSRETNAAMRCIA